MKKKFSVLTLESFLFLSTDFNEYSLGFHYDYIINNTQKNISKLHNKTVNLTIAVI